MGVGGHKHVEKDKNIDTIRPLGAEKAAVIHFTLGSSLPWPFGRLSDGSMNKGESGGGGIWHKQVPGVSAQRFSSSSMPPSTNAGTRMSKLGHT